MIAQKNHIMWFKLNGLLRYLIVHFGCNDLIGYYLVNEYPRSGGSWLSQMVADALGLPFPRDRFPMIRPSIMHGHYYATWNIKNAIVIWRDGRDVLVSQYYFYLFPNDRGNERVVAMSRKALGDRDYYDIRRNLPDFIRYVYVMKKQPKFSWDEFVNQWVDRENIIYVKYEDLRTNTIGELRRVIRELCDLKLSLEEAKRIVGKYEFKKQSKRSAGEENVNSFLRKGIIGDWKNCFSKESKNLFAKYAGDTLVRLGYEQDNSWV